MNRSMFEIVLLNDSRAGGFVDAKEAKADDCSYIIEGADMCGIDYCSPTNCSDLCSVDITG
jgi:hypothetical protein